MHQHHYLTKIYTNNLLNHPFNSAGQEAQLLQRNQTMHGIMVFMHRESEQSLVAVDKCHVRDAYTSL